MPKRNATPLEVWEYGQEVRDAVANLADAMAEFVNATTVKPGDQIFGLDPNDYLDEVHIAVVELDAVLKKRPSVSPEMITPPPDDDGIPF